MEGLWLKKPLQGNVEPEISQDAWAAVDVYSESPLFSLSYSPSLFLSEAFHSP